MIGEISIGGLFICDPSELSDKSVRFQLADFFICDPSLN